MHKSVVLEEFARELLDRGCPEDVARDHLREMADHREDLVSAAIAEGMLQTEAEALADSKLGNPQEWAARLIAVKRQAHWWGRHPVISCCILPPIAVVIALLISLMCFWWLGHTLLEPTSQKSLASGGPGFEYVVIGLSVLYHAIVLATAIVFSILVRRSGYGPQWVLLVCFTCALQGFFGRPGIVPHALTLGYGYSYGQNWICSTLPMIVAAFAYIRWWRAKQAHTRLFSSAAMLVLAGIIVLQTGCANHNQKQIYQRGWIGGQYELATPSSTFNSPNIIHAVPENMRMTNGVGLLVTSLRTNCPAWRAGLREGDLILKVNDQPVSNIKNFRHRIDNLQPGTMVPISVFREGHSLDYNLNVGRETYTKWHNVGLGFFAFSPDLWPNPGFSLIFLGYQRGGGVRKNLDSVENTYLRSCGVTNTVVDPGWHLWAGILSLSAQENIQKQENVTP